MTKPKLAVGMTVWVVDCLSGIGYEQTITKLGRTWAWTDHPGERFDKLTWDVYGSSFLQTHKIYASEQAYRHFKALSLEWELLQKAFIKSSYRGIPDEMTIEKIQQIKALLGMAE